MASYVDSLFSLADKSVFLTGASSGIGEHWAHTICKAGCRSLALCARRTDKLEILAKDLRSKFPGLKVCAVSLDVSWDAAKIAQVFDHAERELGNVTFNVIINNAGIGPNAPILEASPNNFNETMGINVRGPFLVSQEAAKRMISRKISGGGSIINVASIYGLRVGFNNGVYATSKAALIQLSKAMAIELLGQNIRVNVIAPGYYRSEMTSDFYDTPRGQKYLQQKVPSKRLGLLPELDGPLLLLASNASSNMTGSVVVADGGHSTSSL